MSDMILVTVEEKIDESDLSNGLDEEEYDSNFGVIETSEDEYTIKVTQDVLEKVKSKWGIKGDFTDGEIRPL